MFAKLFDGISLRSQVYAALFSTLLLSLSFWLYQDGFLDFVAPSSTSIPAWSIFPLLILVPWLVGLALSEVLNRKHFFAGHYHYWFVFSLLSFALLVIPFQVQALLHLVPIFLFFVMCLSLLQTQAPLQQHFNIGLSLGLLSFWEGSYLLFLPLLWLVFLLLGQMSGRRILAGILGFGGLVYLLLSLSYFTNLHLWPVLFKNLQALKPSWEFDFALEYIFYLPLALVLLILLGSIPGRLGRFNNQQRVANGLAFLLLFFCLLHALLFPQKWFWLSAALLPLSWTAGLWISGTTNPWLRDSFYILLLLSPLGLLLFRFGLLSF